MNKRVTIAAFVLLSMFVLASPAHAQDTSSQGPAGVGVLILLMGLGALATIGAAYSFSGQKNGSSTKTGGDDEDDE